MCCFWVLREDSENYFSLNGLGRILRKGGFLELPLPSHVKWYNVYNNDNSNMFSFKDFIWLELHNLMASYEYIFRVVLGWGDLPGLWHIIMLSFFFI